MALRSFRVVGLAAAALLVLGMWVVPWYTTDAGTPAPGATAGELIGSGRIRLYDVEICHVGDTGCATGSPTELEWWSPALSDATVAVGIVFALLLVGTEVARNRWCAALLLVAAVPLLALVVACCVSMTPTGQHYLVELAPAWGHATVNGPVHGYLPPPSLGFAPLLAAGGALLGMVTAGLTLRRPRESVATEPTPRRRIERDSPIAQGPPRGVETDPFRAPPAPTPIRVVRHDSGDAAPRVEGRDAPPPSILS